MNDPLKVPEKFIKKEKVGYLKSMLQLLNGELFLTEDHLILISNKTTIASGLLGRFIKRKIESKKYGFKLALADVISIEEGKYGVQNIMIIKATEDQNYKIIIKNIPNWRNAILKAKSKCQPN